MSHQGIFYIRGPLKRYLLGGAPNTLRRPGAPPKCLNNVETERCAVSEQLVVLRNMMGEGENSSFFIDLFDPSMLKKQELTGNANVPIATSIEQIGPSDYMPNSGV